MMISGSKPANAALFFFFLVASFKLTHCIINHGNTTICPEVEKNSLLRFKQSLEDPFNMLWSWDNEVDCCKWEGVVCNILTGHVDRLCLSLRVLRGAIDPSLLNLKYLRYLDLSGNNFGEEIPSFIGSFMKLEFLNLSSAGFSGKIPHVIGNLTNLHTLDLGGNDEHIDLNLEADSLDWLRGLSELKYLNMNGVWLHRVVNWPQVINSLPSLQQLHFQHCILYEYVLTPLDDHLNMTSLTHLDLSHNNFRSFSNITWIFQLNLLSLDLSFNIFGGPIPRISNATKLQAIDLSHNSFNSTIPDWFYFCKELEFVTMHRNLLQGTISNFISNLTSLDTLDLSVNELSGKIPTHVANLCKLRYLDLSMNKLAGEITDSFGNMSECFLASLETLSLQNNNLSGHLTRKFGKFKSLRYLNLGKNSLSGAIPDSMGKLSSLELLSIGNNMLEGVVTESHFANLKNLKFLYASMNHLTLNVSSNWDPPFQLITLGIGSWNLGVGSKIPSWIEMQKNISYLDLSSTGIAGSHIPGWFWKSSYLDLSDNHLTGKIPQQVDCEYMYLSSNKFSGSLPRITDSMRELELSNNSFSGGISHFLCDRRYETFKVNILHLGGNQLSGVLPDCWQKWPSLTYLNIGNNNLSGSIPNSIRFCAYLRSLSLAGNKISGQIPFPMHNCTNLMKIDLSDNDLDGSIPTWMGTILLQLRILILRSNKLNSEIPSEICRLNSLQILDLADNQLSGRIPKCVNNFTAMASERMLEKDYYDRGAIFLSAYSYSINSGGLIDSASVATKGTRLQYDTILSLVTNIDLSKNNLSGDIPKELTGLVGLRSLNLSDNHFTGSIPDHIGDMKQLESLDLSRNSLSGQIPNSFTHLSSLAFLNLSRNNLTGKIPESTQFRTFDASCFAWNNLCGIPLTSTCSDDDDKEVNEQEEENEGGEESKIEWFYVVLSLGYAVGLSAVFGALVLKKSWRDGYFGLLGCLWDKVYVCVCIKWAKLSAAT